jgi:hypothetical protein
LVITSYYYCSQKIIIAKKLNVKEDEIKMTVGWKMLTAVFNGVYSQSFHVEKGDEVPSGIDLVDLDSGSKIGLKSICESTVPLILNFGSCT